MSGRIVPLKIVLSKAGLVPTTKDFGEEFYIKKEVKTPGTYYIDIANQGDNRSDLQPYTLTVQRK